MIREVDLWSMVRTLFPLFWIVNTLVILMIMLAVSGSIGEYADDLGFEPDMVPGGMGLFFSSLMLGVLASIFYTALTAVVILCYNALTALGGGIRIVVDDEILMNEEKIADDDSHERDS